ncbi:MAG TPA: anthranilate phosphoribosyltransferase [archaeon]|nr:anthranilate phosphoribosyltransferase [archaeon]
MIQESIKKVVEGKNLSRAEAKQVFDEIMRGEATEVQIASLITALHMKGESVDEIIGAVSAMREACSKVEYSGAGDVLDVVGTGGDGKASFNVSTAAAIVAAGAGCIIAKHGNRSVSSKSGAADVLESLGVKIDNTPEKNSQVLSKIGFVFLFAPMHHPAMKYAAKPRKELGFRTIFNILGPLSNPANASTYLLGVYDARLAEKLAKVLSGLGVKRALVVHGEGYDEATLTGATMVYTVEKGKVKKSTFTPKQLGFKKRSEKEFIVNDPVHSARILMEILEGKEKGAKMDLVVLNAGLAIYANMKAKRIKEGIRMARESIESGSALAKLKELIRESKA